jgi:WD40 repeat protein
MKRESNETVENAKRESNSSSSAAAAATASGATNGVSASASTEINGQHQGPRSNDSKTSSSDSKTPRLQEQQQQHQQNGHHPPPPHSTSSQPSQSQSAASTSSPGENRGFKLTQAPTGSAIDTTSLNALQQKTTTPAHKKKEIYRYTGKDAFYGCAWSNKYMGDSFRIAVCTCVDDNERFDKNRISILEYDEYKNELIERCNFEHGFPATSMMMNPSKSLDSPEILATASNGLKIFKYDRTSQTATLEATMISKPYNMSAAIKDVSPYTCLDWLEVSPEYIATSCIDSTCSIWNIEYGVELSRVKCSIKTQLIAHEKSVNAIAFSNLDSNREQLSF